MRERFFMIYYNAIKQAYPEELAKWLYYTFARWNSLVFGDSLPECLLLFGNTDGLAVYDPFLNSITLSREFITRTPENPTIADVIYRLDALHADESMLHEMMHLKLRGTLAQDSHNNPVWVGEVNRVAAIIGLPSNARVLVDGENAPPGVLSLYELERWPSVRHFVKPEEPPPVELDYFTSWYVARLAVDNVLNGDEPNDAINAAFDAAGVVKIAEMDIYNGARAVLRELCANAAGVDNDLNISWSSLRQKWRDVLNN